MLHVPPITPLRAGPGVEVRVMLCGELPLVGSELHLPLLARGRLPVLVGAHVLLLQQNPDIGLLVLLPLLLLVLVGTWPQQRVLVVLVLLHRVLLLMLLHVLVLVGGRMLLTLLVDNGLLLVGLVVLSVGVL
jgi:hypothetical protein